MPRRLRYVLIALPKSSYDRVLTRIANEGVLHIEEPSRELPGSPSPTYRKLYTQASERASKVASFFHYLNLEPATERGLVIEVSDWESTFSNVLKFYADLEEFYDSRISRLSDLERRADEIKKTLEQLAPMTDIESDIKRAYEAVTLQFALGIAPPGFERECEEASRAGAVVVCETMEDGRTRVAVVGKPEVMRGVVANLSRAGMSLLVVPKELPGSPKEAYEILKRSLEGLETEAEKIRGELKSRLPELTRYYTHLVAFREVFRALSSGLESSSMFFVEGYIDDYDYDRLKKTLDEEAGASYVLLDMGLVRGEARAPTKVALPPVVRSFHKITQMYGEPETGEVVPTLFLAVTFPIAFALMFPDAGHGLVLALFGLLFFGKRNPAWRDVLLVLGAASMITGLLAGEFFGPLGGHLVLEKLFGWISPLPPLALPTYAIEKGKWELVNALLYRAVTICLWIGAFMLSFGTLLGVLNAWIRRDSEELLAMRLPRFIFFTSIALPFLTSLSVSDAASTIQRAVFELGGGDVKATVVLLGALVGLLWMLLGEPFFALKHGHGVGSALISSFMEAFDSILMALGNIPSFLRILALALAHSSIMLGFYYIYHEMSHGGALGLAVGFVLYVFGNLIAIAIEAIIAFAQTLRLHFYEWFSKFYRGTGIPFTPISMPEDVRIVLVSRAPSQSLESQSRRAS
ncbi:MAG: V-type ATPase 116kDa subunit family protein [Acidilobaceae archaeon]